jgi:hypothetical protein
MESMVCSVSNFERLTFVLTRFRDLCYNSLITLQIDEYPPSKTVARGFGRICDPTLRWSDNRLAVAGSFAVRADHLAACVNCNAGNQVLHTVFDLAAEGSVKAAIIVEK